MPHYPKERMSRKQVNDLAAYIRQQATADFP
jgi:mono/diheme cytochrome c family protein